MLAALHWECTTNSEPGSNDGHGDGDGSEPVRVCPKLLFIDKMMLHSAGCVWYTLDRVHMKIAVCTECFTKRFFSDPNILASDLVFSTRTEQIGLKTLGFSTESSLTPYHLVRYELEFIGSIIRSTSSLYWLREDRPRDYKLAFYDVSVTRKEFIKYSSNGAHHSIILLLTLNEILFLPSAIYLFVFFFIKISKRHYYYYFLLSQILKLIPFHAPLSYDFYLRSNFRYCTNNSDINPLIAKL